MQYYHWEHKLLRTFVSTDDGKVGFKGTVIDMFRFNLDKFDIRYKAIYACGPFPMLYELAHNPPSPCRLQVLIETVMGCGFGACKGCTVPGIAGEPLQACKHGPVFYSDKLDWQRLKEELIHL